MRLIVTGGSGLIGSALSAELAGAGHDVVVTSRRPDQVDSAADGVDVREWDAQSKAQLTRILNGADAVIHLVGEGIGDGRWSRARKERIRASRVDSTRAVVEALALANPRPKALIQASAVGYYGGREDELLTEDSSVGEGFLAETCAAWEEAGEQAREVGVRRSILRTGVVLAREGGALPKMALPFKLFAGGPVGDGDQWVPWIHLQDQVAAIRFLTEDENAAGPFNLTAPTPVRNRDFGRALGDVLRRPSFLPTPAAAMRLLLGEMSDLLLEGQRAVPERLIEAGFAFRFERVEDALADLLGK